MPTNIGKNNYSTQKSKRKREKQDSASVEKYVKTLDKKRLLRYVKKNFHGAVKNHIIPGTTASAKRTKNYLPPLKFATNQMEPIFINKNSRINLLHDQFSNTIYHNKLLRQSQLLKKINLGRTELIQKRARLSGIGQLRHQKKFNAYGFPKMKRAPSLDSIEGLLHINNQKNSNDTLQSSNSDKYEAWYAKENEHLIRLARFPTKNKNRMQVDEFINFCRPYFKRANIDIGPDEDDQLLLG